MIYLTKKKQILKSVLCAGHRKELRGIVLVYGEWNPYKFFYNAGAEFDDKEFNIAKHTRDDVIGELFDISLTNWGIVGIHRNGKLLVVRLARTDCDITNLDADVVNWISLLFKPSWKSTMEIASPLEIYYKIGSERKWFSHEESNKLLDLLLFGDENGKW